jgi:hypothetical protein
VLDDAPTPLGTTGDNGYRQSNLIPIKMDWASTGFDTRHRVTLNAFYDLPFGTGRKFLNHNRVLDAVIGGWSTDTTWAAQTGNPFSVGLPGSFKVASGGSANAVLTGDPFKAGGSASNCAVKTKTRTNWYNPCQFANPWNANDPQNELEHYIPKNAADAAATGAVQPVYVTSLSSVLGYLGGRRGSVYGPGYERVNMSIFKNFKVFREQNLQFRADIFNVLNTPSLGEPNDRTNDGSGGNITGPRVFQALTPDSRFFQLSAKYAF